MRPRLGVQLVEGHLVLGPDARAHQVRRPRGHGPPGPDVVGPGHGAVVPGGDAADVALGVVADHVDPAEGAAGAGELLPVVPLQDVPGVPVGRQGGLAKGELAQARLLGARAPHQPVPDVLQRRAERPLAQPRQVVPRAPQQVGVAEDERRLPVGLPLPPPRQPRVPVRGAVRAQVPAVRQQQVLDELDVDGPVARVVEDHDGVDLEAVLEFHGRAGLGVVDGPRERQRLLLGVELLERVEREDLRVGLEDVRRGHHRLEAVVVRDVPRLGGVGAQDEHRVAAREPGPADRALEVRLEVRVAQVYVRIKEPLVRGVALYEVGDAKFYAELLGQFSHALGLELASAVGQEDEGDFLLLEVSKRLGCSWDGL